MDADGLPLVGPGIDYTKVEAINQKRLVAFINHFVCNTAGFLNKFSCVCEEKLENLSHRMQQLEVTMGLLEAKIGSIPGLENVTVASSGSTAAASGGPTATATTDQTTPSATPAPSPAQAPPAGTETPAEQVEPETPPPAANPVSKDPRYMKFFKMLQFGVPEPAVKTKMALEGLNPDMLDTPDAPAPAGGAAPKDDDDDFSTDSDQESDDSDDFD